MVGFLSRAIGGIPGAVGLNGDDAVRRAQCAGPDVIVMDVMMPGGKDGFATYAELQRSQNARHPVIMLTDVNRKLGMAFGAEELTRHLGKAPAAFLEKPVSARPVAERSAKSPSRGIVRAKGAMREKCAV